MNALRLTVHQTAPLRGEVEANLADLGSRVSSERGEALVIFPELSLTGYDLGLRARELALRSDADPPLAPPPGVRVLLGFPELTDDGLLYNSAGLIGSSSEWRGRWLHRHRKIYLPTYGSFDEGRIFAAATGGPEVVELMPGWPGAVLICEDLWHPTLPWLAALRGARLLVVMAAAPGRPVVDEEGAGGARSGDEVVVEIGRAGANARGDGANAGGDGANAGGDGANAGGDGMALSARFRSVEAWRTLARAAAFTHGLWVILANRAGVEGGITFAGSSMVIDPTGQVVAEAGPEVQTLAVDLDPEAVQLARREWSHLRDDDPAHLRRELDRPGGAWLGRAGGEPSGSSVS